MLALLLSLTWLAYGQSVRVAGRVTDGAAGLPGVTVLEKGTATGTSTDADGSFVLQVSSPNATLIFSSIGYATVETQVNNQTSLDVVMREDVTSLHEVVVTALGVQREVKSLGYAVQKVEGETIQIAREPNIMNSLTGRVAGLEIRNQTDLFQNPGIRLRGAMPLLVIDGVPSVDADIWKINADDIASFDVLKGPNAAALYGAIGRNGAIMITTKRGSKAKTTVDINSSTMFQTGFIRIPEVQSTYGNGFMGRYAYVDGSGGGLEGGGWIWGPRLNQPDPATPSGFWETPQFNSPIDQVTGNRIPLPFISRGADNVRNFFRTGIISTNNISISSGNADGNFRVSISNNYQQGIVPNTQLNNTSFGVAGGYRLAKNLKADASMTYNRQFTDNFPEIGYGPHNYLYNLVLWTGTDVDVRDLRNYWETGQENIQQRHFNRSWYNNPFFQAYEFRQGFYRDNVFGQLRLDYNVLPGLDIMLRSGMNQFSLNRTWKEPRSFVTYDHISLGDLRLLNESHLDLNTDLLARYKKNFSENFAVNASVGLANRWRSVRSQTQSSDGLAVPGFFHLSNSARPLRGNNNVQEENVNSVFSTVDFEFFGGIFLGFTGRQDWVSTMPIANNSFFYPSVSLAGVITDFVDLSPAKISFLKVRGSWAQVTDGQIRLPGRGVDFYQHIPGYDPGINWAGSPSLRFPGTLIDPGIRPETSETFEFGMDVRFLNGRLGLDAAVFNIRDFNNIFSLPMSNASGFTNRLVNGGEFLRRGLELTVTATPVKSNAFRWDVLLNYSRVHRYLESSFDGSGRLGIIREGERMDQLFQEDFRFQRAPDGQLILGANGLPLRDPFPQFRGFSDSDFIFGFVNNFSYKNFTLGVSFDGRVGGVMYSTTNQKMWWGGTHPGTVNEHREAANAGVASFVAPGVVVVSGSAEFDSDGNILRDTRVFEPNSRAVNYITWNVRTSNAFLSHFYNQSFVKLREVTLMYQIPTKVLSKLRMSRASIGFVGRNLALWSEMPEVDPDSGSDNLQTPSTRSIGFNLNLSF
jgi:TonB-linked SusC/RagA family outer membrane protein